MKFYAQHRKLELCLWPSIDVLQCGIICNVQCGIISHDCCTSHTTRTRSSKRCLRKYEEEIDGGLTDQNRRMYHVSHHTHTAPARTRSGPPCAPARAPARARSRVVRSSCVSYQSRQQKEVPSITRYVNLQGRY